MPLYEYECSPHKHRFEVRQGINDEPVQNCPECSGPVRRVIQPVGVVFKGTGFYVTDSRKSNPASKPKEAGATEPSKAESTTTDSGSSEKSSESKTNESKSSESKSSESKGEPSAAG
jgi:putative FmdB family regulatory protein